MLLFCKSRVSCQSDYAHQLYLSLVGVSLVFDELLTC